MADMGNTHKDEALDEQWYARLEPLCFEDYEKLTGTKEHREAQMEAFLRNEIRNPALDYPELEHFDIEGRERELTALKDDIEAHEKDPVIKALYRAKIHEMLASLNMLRAAREGDDVQFSRYCDLVYGKPEPESVSYVVLTIEELAREKRSSGDQQQKEAAERLLPILEGIERTTITKADKQVLPDGADIDGEIESVDEAVEVFTKALKEQGIDDWSVVVDTEKGVPNFSVSQEHKEVRIPSEEALLARKLTRKKLQGLVAHEIETHVARRHFGERSKLKLLGLGLDGYLYGEEGIAAYNEQQVIGANEFSGLVRYFAIITARGFDGTPRDFRETFALMRDYFLLSMESDPERDEAVDNEAWTFCVRIFRGTTCATPGAVFTKDMVYFGNRDIWTLIARRNDVVNDFLLGKFDPNNEKHQQFLSDMGMLQK